MKVSGVVSEVRPPGPDTPKTRPRMSLIGSGPQVRESIAAARLSAITHIWPPLNVTANGYWLGAALNGR